MRPLLRRAHHAKRDGREENEETDDDGIENGEESPLDHSVQWPGDVVGDEAEAEDGKVEGGILSIISMKIAESRKLSMGRLRSDAHTSHVPWR